MKTADIIFNSEKENPNPVVETGLTRLDEAGFLREGKVTLLAGRPAMGKTMFASNIAAYLLSKDEEVCYVSFENSAKMTIEKVLATGNTTEEKLRNLYIEDDPGSNMRARALFDRIKEECPNVKLIIIDYIQLIGSEVIQWIYDAFPKAAILILSQASRAAESRPGHAVELSDIKDIGFITPYLYNISYIYRDEYYHPASEEDTTTLIVNMRNREGMSLRKKGYSLSNNEYEYPEEFEDLETGM